jgi:hypothetical protein
MVCSALWQELDERIATIRARCKLECSVLKQQQQQVCKGLDQEMEHNLKMEWIKPKETAVSAQRAWPNRFNKSLTFCGSIIASKAFGGEVELPSLCTLHQADERNKSTRIGAS